MFEITKETLQKIYDWAEESDNRDFIRSNIRLVLDNLDIHEALILQRNAKKIDAEQLREDLAEYAHQTWSGWMLYLFDQCQMISDGTALIPAWAVNHWKRQAGTSYNALPEDTKTSDRVEADRMLDIIREYIDLPKQNR